MTTIENPNAKSNLKKKKNNILSIIVNSKAKDIIERVIYIIASFTLAIVAFLLLYIGSNPKEDFDYSNVFVISIMFFSFAILFVIMLIEIINKEKNNWRPWEASFGSFINWCFMVPGLVEVLTCAFDKVSSGIYFGAVVVFTIIWHLIQLVLLYRNFEELKVTFLNICDQVVLVMLTVYWVVFKIDDFKGGFAILIGLFMLMQMGINIVVYMHQKNQENQ